MRNVGRQHSEAMNIYPQQTAIHLPEDQFLELVLVQWHTPIPGVGQKIEDRVKAEKAGVLQGLGSEIGGMCGEDGHPVFVVIPELSLPVAHIELIEELLNDANVPIVVIAGFEFMSWQEYDEVARQFSNTPQIEICHQNLQANTFVNTAGIWIKELCNDGTWAVRRYIQSKLWPSDPEQGRVHPGQNVIVFKSEDQTTGKRFNFCVQICSDFCSAAHVAQLRSQIENRLQGVPLDVTFLPQMNKDQEAPQFRDTVGSYFEPQRGQTLTKDGCLVFVNNGSTTPGHRSAFGSSRLYFTYGCWRKLEAQNDYWIKDYDTHQAVIVRENGPGIYWFRYRPHCWINRRPGTDQAVPFPRTDFSPLEQHKILSRASLLPEAHWLEQEWREGKDTFQQTVRANREHLGEERRDIVLPQVMDAYNLGVAQWIEDAKHKYPDIKLALKQYFQCWKEKEDYPEREHEPFRWPSEVSRGVRQLMQSYALLYMGVSGSAELMPRFKEGLHAHRDRTLGVLFLWGGGDWTPTRMIRACKDSLAVPSTIYGSLLLVLLQPSATPGRETLRDILSLGQDRIDRAQPFDTPPDHLKEQGSVTRAYADTSLSLVYGGEMLHVLFEAVDEATLVAKLRHLVANVLKDAEE